MHYWTFSSKTAFVRSCRDALDRGETVVFDMQTAPFSDQIGDRELVKMQSNGMALRLPVDHPRYNELPDGSWSYWHRPGDLRLNRDGETLERWDVASYDDDTPTLVSAWKVRR